MEIGKGLVFLARFPGVSAGGKKKDEARQGLVIYLQAQYQLHTGRILVCLSGILVAMLSVTGVYIWLRKRRAARARL